MRYLHTLWCKIVYFPSVIASCNSRISNPTTWANTRNHLHFEWNTLPWFPLQLRWKVRILAFCQIQWRLLTWIWNVWNERGVFFTGNLCSEKITHFQLRIQNFLSGGGDPKNKKADFGNPNSLLSPVCLVLLKMLGDPDPLFLFYS